MCLSPWDRRNCFLSRRLYACTLVNVYYFTRFIQMRVYYTYTRRLFQIFMSFSTWRNTEKPKSPHSLLYNMHRRIRFKKRSGSRGVKTFFVNENRTRNNVFFIYSGWYWVGRYEKNLTKIHNFAVCVQNTTALSYKKSLRKINIIFNKEARRIIIIIIFLQFRCRYYGSSYQLDDSNFIRVV